jgi:hypothetical protein
MLNWNDIAEKFNKEFLIYKYILENGENIELYQTSLKATQDNILHIKNSTSLKKFVLPISRHVFNLFVVPEDTEKSVKIVFIYGTVDYTVDIKIYIVKNLNDDIEIVDHSQFSTQLDCTYNNLEENTLLITDNIVLIQWGDLCNEDYFTKVYYFIDNNGHIKDKVNVSAFENFNIKNCITINDTSLFFTMIEKDNEYNIEKIYISQYEENVYKFCVEFDKNKFLPKEINTRESISIVYFTSTHSCICIRLYELGPELKEIEYKLYILIDIEKNEVVEDKVVDRYKKVCVNKRGSKTELLCVE